MTIQENPGQTPSATTSLVVEGMTCGSCVQTVEKALMGVPGTERALVDRPEGSAHVQGSAAPTDLIRAVEKAGYNARVADGSTQDAVPSKRSGCCC